MRKYLKQRFHKPDSGPELEPEFNPRPRWPRAWPLNDGCARPEIQTQQQCPLFAKLSAEIRVLLYRAALTDPSRFLHICRNRVELEPTRPAAHFWCIDMDSPYPTWQHKCYGESLELRLTQTAFCRRSITETNDKMLSLLLACRSIYSEALPILYQGNRFHFRGAPSLLAFRSSLSTMQWHAIRHIHISTVYTPEAVDVVQDRRWPPESPDKWKRMCEHLLELPKLETLSLDLILQVGPFNCPSNMLDRMVRGGLEPLSNVRAKTLEIELNVEPEKIRELLGDVKFEITVRERPYNVALYKERTQMTI
ncbi:hypothetical protein K458DRAFT_197252 [Lentithecium fluviatile CBS 122367]|uniref:DUF7730 domain-containing protein n=1 Tax=Lentithecium fluviatile CBS 122367 TaxID=1168545 RepID=A0A6G1IC51_9PLEO|nr:hypothetical protein K458DRAFT_197252 [Lentithecium fluviatile CBS 122367]